MRRARARHWALALSLVSIAGAHQQPVLAREVKGVAVAVAVAELGNGKAATIDAPLPSSDSPAFLETRVRGGTWFKQCDNLIAKCGRAQDLLFPVEDPAAIEECKSSELYCCTVKEGTGEECGVAKCHIPAIGGEGCPLPDDFPFENIPTPQKHAARYPFKHPRRAVAVATKKKDMCIAYTACMANVGLFSFSDRSMPETASALGKVDGANYWKLSTHVAKAAATPAPPAGRRLLSKMAGSGSEALPPSGTKGEVFYRFIGEKEWWAHWQFSISDEGPWQSTELHSIWLKDGLDAFLKTAKWQDIVTKPHHGVIKYLSDYNPNPEIMTFKFAEVPGAEEDEADDLNENSKFNLDITGAKYKCEEQAGFTSVVKAADAKCNEANPNDAEDNAGYNKAAEATSGDAFVNMCDDSEVFKKFAEDLVALEDGWLGKDGEGKELAAATGKTGAEKEPGWYIAWYINICNRVFSKKALAGDYMSSQKGKMMLAIESAANVAAITAPPPWDAIPNFVLMLISFCKNDIFGGIIDLLCMMPVFGKFLRIAKVAIMGTKKGKKIGNAFAAGSKMAGGVAKAFKKYKTGNRFVAFFLGGGVTTVFAQLLRLVKMRLFGAILATHINIVLLIRDVFKFVSPLLAGFRKFFGGARKHWHNMKSALAGGYWLQKTPLITPLVWKGGMGLIGKLFDWTKAFGVKVVKDVVPGGLCKIFGKNGNGDLYNVINKAVGELDLKKGDVSDGKPEAGFLEMEMGDGDKFVEDVVHKLVKFVVQGINLAVTLTASLKVMAADIGKLMPGSCTIGWLKLVGNFAPFMLATFDCIDKTCYLVNQLSTKEGVANIIKDHGADMKKAMNPWNFNEKSIPGASCAITIAEQFKFCSEGAAPEWAKKEEEAVPPPLIDCSPTTEDATVVAGDVSRTDVMEKALAGKSASECKKVTMEGSSCTEPLAAAAAEPARGVCKFGETVVAAGAGAGDITLFPQPSAYEEGGGADAAAMEAFFKEVGEPTDPLGFVGDESGDIVGVPMKTDFETETV